MIHDAEAQYEYEERIAMRMEAGCDPASADHLARVDLSHRSEEVQKMATLRAGGSLERLLVERSRVAELWKNEDDPQRVVKLRERWCELSIEIATIKCKESENGNDGRVSG
jgi:hypothetical protein